MSSCQIRNAIRGPASNEHRTALRAAVAHKLASLYEAVQNTKSGKWHGVRSGFSGKSYREQLEYEAKAKDS